MIVIEDIKCCDCYNDMEDQAQYRWNATHRGRVNNSYTAADLANDSYCQNCVQNYIHMCGYRIGDFTLYD